MNKFQFFLIALICVMLLGLAIHFLIDAMPAKVADFDCIQKIIE